MGIYNVSKIENWFDDFASASKKYNEYYNDFKSSYICSCGDSTISKMKKNLIEHYSRISKINNRINDIWKKYIHDLKAIDNALAGHKANFNDSTLSTKISKLPSLTTYKANLNTKINSASASIGTVTDIGWSETGSFLKNIKSFGEAIGATGAVVATSIESGIFKFLEDSADKLVFIIALSASEISEATGDKEWAQHIRDEATEMIVADNAKDYNDIFYKQTEIGRKINEKSMLKYDSKFGNKTQNAAKNVVKPVVSVLTGGAGSLIFGFLGGSSVEDKLKETGADLNKIAGETIIQSTIDAIDSYGKGKMGRGALDAAKAVTSTGSVKTALSDLVKTVFKKSNGKILTKETLKNTFKDVLKDPDTYLDSVYAALDNVKYDNENGLQVNWKGFAKETACNFAMNSVFSFIGSAFETKMTNGMKNKIEVTNSKNVEFPSNVNDNLDAFRKEYNELLNKSKESWFIKAKEAGDNGWAWALNEVDEVDKTIMRMKELEGALGIKETGIPKSKIYDYSKAKKEADALVRKISKEPIPGYKNIDTNSQEYKKVVKEIYSKPSPSGKQDLSQIENPFNFSKQSSGVHTSKSNVENKINLKQKVNEKISHLLKRKKLKVFADYNGDLKSYISDGMPKKLDPVEKARYIYCKLNNEVSYSNKWNSQKLVTIDEKGIYNKKIDLSNYNGEEIICSNWSEMYSELLRDNGINCAVRGTDGSHKWVVFENNGKYYMADATNKFDKANDLTRIQGGVQSYGFIEITREQAMSNRFANNIFEVQNAHKNNKLNVDRMDKKLGFNYKDADKLFSTDFKNGNSMKELKYLGLDSNATTIDIIEAKLEKDLFKKMDKMGTIEGLMYFRNRKNAIFTLDEIRNVNDKWIVNKYTGEMCVLYKVSGGKNYLYTGKNNIKVVDNDFANNYLNYGFINYS